jgi:hypothetical protein
LDNNVLGIRKIDSPDEMAYMPLGSKIKVIRHKSDFYEEGEENFAVKYGDKIGWEDGSSDELQTLISGINNYHCIVYLDGDKALALYHLYEICMKNIEDIQSKEVEKWMIVVMDVFLLIRNWNI